MPGKSITLDLPEELYERVRQVAEQSQRPLEGVLVESIHLLFVLPPTSTDVATTLAALPSYADARLWAVVYQRLTWPQSQRPHTLSAKNKLLDSGVLRLHGCVRECETFHAYLAGSR